MSLAQRQLAVARLLTDPAWRARFFAPDATPEDFDLADEDFRVVRQLDPRRLDVVSEGYMGKRLERIASSFPRTLALLLAVEPGARGDYLAQTAFAADDAAERASFSAWLARRLDPDSDAGRLLLDALDVETALAAAPPAALASAAPLPDDARPRLRSRLVPVRGPLVQVLDAGALPPRYPDEPGHVAALRRPEGPAVLALDAATRALLEACDGERDVAALLARFGPGARGALEGWARLGALAR